MKHIIAIYVRESTKMQADFGYNLETQEKSCLHYAKALGLKGEIKIYREKGYSAKTIDRPILNGLITDIENGQVKTLIIYKLDRLVRRLKGLNELVELFENSKIKLISVKESINTKSAIGKFFVNFTVMIAEWEQDTISERTNEGLSTAIEKGNYIFGGKVPFGYTRYTDVVNGNKILEIDKKASAVIKKIFELLIANKSMYEIMVIINSMEYMKSINKTYKIRGIEHVLRSKVYCGFRKFKGKEYQLNIPIIIDLETFEQVQKILKKRKHIHKYNYLFGDKIRCVCGNHTRLESSVNGENNAYLYYYCSSCNKRINEQKILDKVIDYLLYCERQQFENKKLYEIEKEINRLEELKNRIYHLFLKKEITDVVYVEELKRIEKQIQSFKNQNEEHLNYYYAYFHSLNMEEKRKLIILYIDYIVVDMEEKIIIRIV